MKKNILYYSSDKLYKIKKKILNKKVLKIILITLTVFFGVLSYFCIKNSITTGRNQEIVKYKEKGDIKYKVYLKDNNYYEDSFLEEGMQYIASLIKTINVDFNYKMDSTQNIQYKYKYKINSNLQITDKNNNSRILYTKNETILEKDLIHIEDDGFIIDEDIDIDYDKYNDYVNSFKRDYGLTIDSNLILTLEVESYGNYNETDNIINNSNKLQISIPLNEQTVNIKIDTDEINNDGNVIIDGKFSIKSIIVLMIGIILLILFLLSSYCIIYEYIKVSKKDIYKNKLNKILKDYDRLIVSGKTDFDENNYPNKIYIDNFEDMVDASERLNTPIIFYEVIPNEKCFFVIFKDATIYKYRLTKAYLEKNGKGR